MINQNHPPEQVKVDFTSKMRNRLILFIIAPITLLIAVFGFYMYTIVEQGFQDEMSKRLIMFANFAGSKLKTQTIETIANGDEDTVLYRNMRERLLIFKKKYDLSRIYVFNRENRSIIDTDAIFKIGDEYINHSLYEDEIKQLDQRKAISTILYSGSDGRMYMTAFSTVEDLGEQGYFIAVEADASFFHILDKIKRNIFQLMILGLIAAGIVASLFVGQILKPLSRVIRAIVAISEGKMDNKIDIRSRDEIGFLINKFNEMQDKIAQRDRHLQMMLKGIAHEVRNPLGGIELFTGILEEELDGQPKLKENLIRIKRETKNLQNLVDEFLHFARPIHLEREWVDLSDYLGDILTFFKTDIEEKKISVVVDVGTAPYFCDAEHMRRVFFNLLKNALTAINHGQGKISIKRTLIVNADNVKDLIEFEDNGEGIKEEHLPNVFNPFFTTKEKGSGLGLALAKKVIDEHDGNISISSKPGRGTSVSMTLYYRR